MAAFQPLFGDTLKSKAGTVPTAEALDNKTAIFVYFSAHWCPPCRGFTPKLSEFHTKHSGDKNFATVFVSSDNSEGEFDEYFGEMPWLALPYDQRDLKASLSKKFGVQGIPMLVVLGPDGKVITKDGRSKVMENFDTCAGFPWTPMTFSEALGDSFLKQDGSTVGKDAIAGKTLGIYFSAHWCPPCRGFTPKLKEFYAAYKAKDPNFEIVFVSSDKSEDEMVSYFKNDHGDYLALPFAKRAEKGELSNQFGVEGIPTFVVVSADGETLNKNGRGKVMAGAEAVVEQGWAPPSVGDLAEGPEAAGTDINETPTIVMICEGCDDALTGSCIEAMKPLAQKYIDEGKKAGEDPKYIFLVSKDGSGGIMEQLKEVTKAAAGEQLAAMKGKPVMIMFDIPDNGGFYVSSTQDITKASIEAFISSKEEKKEKRLQLG